MWILLAVASALFAGLTAVLAKLGVRTTDSVLATALRTPVILVGAWAMTVLSGSVTQLGHVPLAGLGWLACSGLATGASWLCYFRALQLGNVSQVAPVDKMSTVLTVLLAVGLLGEPLGPLGWVGLVTMTVGTLLMLEPDDLRALAHSLGPGVRERGWLVYACGSAFFAALTAILSKLGVAGADAVPSDLATAVRTLVVLIMVWTMVAVSRLSQGAASGGRLRVVRRELGWVLASGAATCASWLCYFAALADGPASVVVPIDKLGVLVTVGFSVLVLGERVGCRSLAGLVLLTAGTIMMAVG
ncbi:MULTISPECIES: EamA family transporter [Actinomyces]|uniref:EamA family transporter n=1 Tax=Actinomyces respiraculi TaxID=2744574 RepID=A0A7T0LJK9_9ACTO|nr:MULTISPECIES: EamA family transporter [Actinomyces]QPL04601.1 EamA family transporter [Actinomyces respiraculi]